MNAKSLELQITVAANQAVTVINNLQNNFKQLAKSAQEFSGNSNDIKKTIDELSSSAERTAKSIKLFGANSSELKNEQTKLKNGILDLVQHGMNPESEEVQNLISQYKKLGDQSEKLENQESGLLGVFEKMKNEIGNLATVAAAVKWDSMMVGLGSNTLQIADNFQTVRNEFGVLLGDLQAGAALFDDVIKPFNDFTPFDLETTAQATKIFMAAKVPISDLTTMLNRMGNIAQGNSQKMLSFANAFSKASAKGKADMEVLNVYLDQGIPILDELAKGFNCTTEEITKMASKGEISFKDFQLALERLTAAGGAYAGGMELASRSYAAMWEGLHEALNSLAASIGSIFLPAAVKVLEWLTNITNAINNSPLVKGLLVGALVAITAAINGKMIVSLVAMIAKLWAAFAAQMALNTALSVTNLAIAAATLAVGALAAGYVTYASKQQKAADETNRQALALKEADQAAQNYLKTIKQMDNTQLQAELIVDSSAMASVEQQIGYLKREMAKYSQESSEYQNFASRLAEAEAYKKEIQLRMETARKQRQTNAENDAIADTAEKAKLRDQYYSQTIEGQIEEVKAQIAWAKSLYGEKYAERDENGNFKNSDKFSSTKTDAIVKMFEEKLANLYKQKNGEKSTKTSTNEEKKQEENKLKLADIGTEWATKFKGELEKIQDEQNNALQNLSGKAIEAFGITFETNENYLKEKAALEKYYADQVTQYEKKCAEEEKARILERHDLQIKTLQDEYTFIAEKAREQLDMGNFSAENVGNFAMGSAMVQIFQTELGSIISSIVNGADAAMACLSTFVVALINAVFELENVQKLLSPFSTVIEGLMAYSQELLNDALQPIVDILLDLGKTIGQIIQPVIGIIATALRVLAGVVKIVTVPLNALGNAFEWLYNKVIRPVGNAIIKVINVIITALNKIPLVNVKKLELLPIAGEKIEEIADATSKAADAARAKIEAMYKAQIDDINEELRYQIQSLQKQYELGLISRQQYIDQKNAYKAAADDKILEIEQQMAVALEHIEENTYAALDAQQKQVIENQREDSTSATKSYAEKWGSVVPVLGGIAGGVVDIGVGVLNGVKTAATGFVKGFKNFFGFAVGTDNIPYDMPAMVHKGEGVIPKTFNEAIKNGTYALVGRSKKENPQQAQSVQSGNSINVSVHVEGNVIKQKDLVKEIYNGLADLINSGASPLPA